jgi:hypothetical protein
MRENPRKDNEAPKCAKSQMDSDAPRVPPYIESSDPNFETALTENDEPKLVKSKSEIADPQRLCP